jgi:hypothetical protein
VLLFSQKGSINDPVAMGHYCRVIVETDRGEEGEYPTITQKLKLSNREIDAIDQQVKSQTFRLASQAGGKILSWEPFQIVSVNGVDMFKFGYSRSLKNASPVAVSVYSVQNNDVTHRITISYRESEKHLWASDLARILKSFKFIKR